MTKSEAAKLVFTVMAGYPVYYRNISENELKAMTDLWTAVLEGYSYDDCYAAVITYIRKGAKEILQTPGQVVDIIEGLKDKGTEYDLTPADAWNIVRPAIRDSLYHAKEHFDEFPDVIKAAVGTPERLSDWGKLPSETVDSVIKSDFCNRTFPTILKRHREDSRLPQSVYMAIEHKRKEHECAEKLRLENLEASRNTAALAGKQSDPCGQAPVSTERIAELRNKHKAINTAQKET